MFEIHDNVLNKIDMTVLLCDVLTCRLLIFILLIIPSLILVIRLLLTV